MKILVALGFVAVLGSLGAALYYMLKGGPADAADGSDEAVAQRRSRGMARALAFRVGFSILIFLAMLLAFFMGWVKPTGLPLR